MKKGGVVVGKDVVLDKAHALLGKTVGLAAKSHGSKRAQAGQKLVNTLTQATTELRCVEPSSVGELYELRRAVADCLESFSGLSDDSSVAGTAPATEDKDEIVDVLHSLISLIDSELVLTHGMPRDMNPLLHSAREALASSRTPTASLHALRRELIREIDRQTNALSRTSADNVLTVEASAQSVSVLKEALLATEQRLMATGAPRSPAPFEETTEVKKKRKVKARRKKKGNDPADVAVVREFGFEEEGEREGEGEADAAIIREPDRMELSEAYPRRVLADDNATIVDAGAANASLVQRAKR